MYEDLRYQKHDLGPDQNVRLMTARINQKNETYIRIFNDGGGRGDGKSKPDTFIMPIVAPALCDEFSEFWQRSVTCKCKRQ